MTTTNYTFNGYPDSTDITAVSGFSLLLGSTGDIVINADGYLDFNANLSIAVVSSTSYNHSITTTVVSSVNNDSFLCVVNAVDSNNFYAARCTGGNFELFQKYTGTFSLLVSAAGSLSGGDTFTLEYLNNKLTLKKNTVAASGFIDITPTNILTPSYNVGVHGRQSATDFINELSVSTLSTAVITAIDDPIEAGTSFNFTTSGMGDITTITTDAAGVTVSSITNTSAALSGWVNAGLYPELPSGVEFTFGDGTLTATANSNISIPDGYTKVSVVSPELSNTTFFAAAVLAQDARTMITGDRVFVSEFTKAGGGIDEFFTMRADTWLSCYAPGGTFTAWLWVSAGADAGKMYEYNVTVAAGGGITVSSGLTSVGLTTSGFTIIGLTAIGL
jgi:hypothetical protein